MDIDRNIVNQLSNLVNKEYRFGGRGPDSYDCFGIFLKVNEIIGIKIPDYSEMCIIHSSISVSEEINKFKRMFLKVSFEDIKIGDAVVVNSLGIMQDSIGVVIDKVEFMQSTFKYGRVQKVRFDHPFYSVNIEGFYRWISN